MLTVNRRGFVESANPQGVASSGLLNQNPMWKVLVTFNTIAVLLGVVRCVVVSVRISVKAKNLVEQDRPDDDLGVAMVVRLKIRTGTKPAQNP